MSEIRPQFFLVRENDTIVPLIALDELPAEITISGVARTLGMADTGGMTSVGRVPSRGVIYVVNGVSESNEDRFFANGKVKGRFGNKKVSDDCPPSKKKRINRLGVVCRPVFLSMVTAERSIAPTGFAAAIACSNSRVCHSFMIQVHLLTHLLSFTSRLLVQAHYAR